MSEKYLEGKIWGVYSGETPIDVIHKISIDLERCNEENAQLKADLNELKRKNALLRQRPDLPVDRLPAMEAFENEAKLKDARIAMLRDTLVLCHNAHDDYYIEQQEVIRVLNETPQQSLIEIQMKSIDLCKQYVMSGLLSKQVNESDFDSLKEQLRNSVKGGE